MAPSQPNWSIGIAEALRISGSKATSLWLGVASRLGLPKAKFSSRGAQLWVPPLVLTLDLLFLGAQSDDYPGRHLPSVRSLVGRGVQTTALETFSNGGRHEVLRSSRNLGEKNKEHHDSPQEKAGSGKSVVGVVPSTTSTERTFPQLKTPKKPD